MKLKDITKTAVIISEDATFEEALTMMLTAHTNTLLVTDTDGLLTGEVSVSDLFDGIIPFNEDGDAALSHFKSESTFAETVQKAANTPVFEFMSSDFTAIHLDGDIMEVAATAIAHGRARMPVIDHDGRPIGMISRQGLKQILGKFLSQK